MVQEEAIASWIEAMDEKKKGLKEKQARVDALTHENEQLMVKMGKVKDDYDNVVKENLRLNEARTKLDAV